MIDKTNFSRQLDQKIIEFENWCKENNSTDAAAYCQQMDLGSEILQGLEQVQQMENWLTGIVDLEESTIDDNPPEVKNDTVGNYRLQRRVGSGGMGTVWLARQSHPVKRQVAIKLIRMDRESAVIVKRFEREKQALALMSHSHIAKVHDAGITDDDRPYIAMEYIEGNPLIEYCQQNDCSLVTRLGLFLQLCSAIQHAHQKGLLHRDIKPSNVLVTELEGAPTVKVIDFGLVRSCSEWDPEISQTEMAIGSPLWMSPEQAAGIRSNATDEEGRNAVDTRSDIYSLGVILYQLLTDSTPITEDFFEKATNLELLNAIQNEIPDLPSTRISRRYSGSQKSTPIYSWARILRNELDWVTMRALSKDREKRYSTVAAFAEDVHNYLNHEPVTARPPSLSYRLRKLAQKHRVSAATLVATAVATVLACVCLVLITMMAMKGKQDALQAEMRARNTMGLMTKLLNNFNPSENGSKYKPSQMKLLDEFRDEIDAKDFTHDPLLEAEYRKVLANVYSGSGEHNAAVDQMLQVISVCQGKLGDDHRSTIAARLTLADEYLLHWYNASASSLATSCYDKAIELLGVEDELSIKARRIIIDSQRDLLNTDDMVAQSVELVEKSKHNLGELHAETINCMALLATAYNESGRVLDAAQQIEKTVHQAEEVFGPFARQSMELKLLSAQMKTISGQSDRKGKLDKLLDEAIDKFGIAHLFTLRLKLLDVNRVVSRGDHAKAEPVLIDTLKKCSANFGKDHDFTLTLRSRLGLLYYQWARSDDKTHQYKNLDRSLKIFQEVLADHVRLKGPTSLSTIKCRISIAAVYIQNENYPKVDEIVDGLLPLIGNRLNNDSRMAAQLMYFKTVSLFELGRVGEAVEYAEQAYQLSLKHYDQPSSETAKIAFLQGLVAARKGLQQEAIGFFESAFESYFKLQGNLGRDTHWCLAQLQNLSMETRDFKSAERHARKSIELLAPTMSQFQLFEQGANLNLGEALCENGRFDEGEPLLHKACNSELTSPPQLMMRYRAKAALALRPMAEKKFAKAKKILLDAKQGMKTTSINGSYYPFFVWFFDRIDERLARVETLSESAD